MIAATATLQAFCPGCDELVDTEDLTPDHNGDPACQDCHTTWADLDDATEWRAYAYH